MAQEVRCGGHVASRTALRQALRGDEAFPPGSAVKRPSDERIPKWSGARTGRAPDSDRYLSFSGMLRPFSSQNFKAPGCRGTDTPSMPLWMLMALAALCAVAMSLRPCSA